MTWLVAALGLSAMPAPVRLEAAGQASFQGLGTLSGTSQAWDISRDGSTVVGHSGALPFRWTEQEGMVALDLGPLASARAEAVSWDGGVIAGQGSLGAVPQVFRWTSSTGLINHGSLSSFQDVFAISSQDISADGSVFVGWEDGSGGFQSFRWTQATGLVSLSGMTNAEGQAFATAADGATIAGTSDVTTATPGVWQPYVWTQATGPLSLGELPGGFTFSWATAITPDATVLAGSGETASGEKGFRWTSAGGFTLLEDLPGETRTLVNDISADGAVLVGTVVAPGSSAFIWDQESGKRLLQDVLEQELGLDLTAWSLQQARGISADGSAIVGWGTNPDGDTEAWLARLPGPTAVPLLPTWLFVLLGLLLAGAPVWARVQPRASANARRTGGG